MKTIHVAALALALALPAAPAFAQDYKLGGIEIERPWTRATPKGAAVAGGYLKIKNAGAAPDRLVGGSTPFAGRFEVHEMAMKDGVMTMRHLKQGLEIKPGQEVELKPGSYHVMFMDLKQQLNRGERVKGTLVFEKAGTIEIEYAVEAIGAREPQGAHGKH